MGKGEGDSNRPGPWYELIVPGEKAAKYAFHCKHLYVFCQLEEEIVSLKQVLESKEKRQAELKHLLGMTTLNELKQNLSRGWNDVQSTTV